MRESLPPSPISYRRPQKNYRSHSRWAYDIKRRSSLLYQVNSTEHCDCHPLVPAMKLTFALVLVSLSVLTAAKQNFVRKHKEHHHHECANSTALSVSATNPVTPLNEGTSTPASTPAPTNSPTPKVNAAVTTAQSSGWVQNPQGKASFTAYSGCQYACKLRTRPHIFMV